MADSPNQSSATTGSDALSSAISTALSSAIASSATPSSSSSSSFSSSSSYSSTSARPTPTSVSQAINATTGSAQSQQGVSLETFLASLSVAAVVFGVQVVLFVLLRKKMKRVYEPRTYLVPEKYASTRRACMQAGDRPRERAADFYSWADGERLHPPPASSTSLGRCVSVCSGRRDSD